MAFSLNEMIGLPSATESADLAVAAERRYQALVGQAADGNSQAHDELIALRVTHIAWVYGKQGGPLPAGTDRPRRHSDKTERHA